MTEKKKDFVSSIVLLIFSALFFTGAGTFPTNENAAIILSTGFYPQLLAGILGFLSMLLFISAMRRPYKQDEKPDQFWKNWQSFLLYLSVIIALIAYPFIMELLGFAVATLVFITSLVFALSEKGKKTPLITIGVSLGITSLIYIIFKLILAIPFPSGLLI